MAKSKKAKRVKKVKRASRPKAKVRVPAKQKKMLSKELKIYKTLLLKERENSGGELSHITRDSLNKSQRDASGDLSGYSYHMADVASDNYEIEFSLGRASDEQKLLYCIDEALRRVEDRTYGYCLQCNKAIPRMRLRVVPHTELCIDCQKANESK